MVGEGVGGKVHLEVLPAERYEGHRDVARQWDAGMPDLLVESDKGRTGDLLWDSPLVQNKKSGRLSRHDKEVEVGG